VSPTLHGQRVRFLYPTTNRLYGPPSSPPPPPCLPLPLPLPPSPLLWSDLSLAKTKTNRTIWSELSSAKTNRSMWCMRGCGAADPMPSETEAPRSAVEPRPRGRSRGNPAPGGSSLAAGRSPEAPPGSEGRRKLAACSSPLHCPNSNMPSITLRCRCLAGGLTFGLFGLFLFDLGSGIL
jgi:hypothetical protein